METTPQAKDHVEIAPDKIQLFPDSLNIYQPRYTDEAKTRIKALVKFPDGKISELEGIKSDKNSPFIRDVFSQYSETELEMFTFREQCISLKREEINKLSNEDKNIEQERQETFHAKARALNMPEIASCKDEELLRKIRRARNAFEVTAWAAVLLSKTPADKND